MKRKKKTDRAKLIKEMDELCASLVKHRDRHICQRCLWNYHRAGKKKPTTISGRNEQWAHVYSRRHLRLRHDVWNSLVLCSPHHRWWHSEPLASAAWFRKMFFERRTHLEEELKVISPVRISELRQRHAELKALLVKGE